MKIIMKTLYLLISSALLCITVSAQTFQVGHTTVTFNDPARTGGFGSGGGAGRQIQSEIYYPANTAGETVPVAPGKFPVIVFGHGFVMTWDAYQNIWNELVPEGYILVFPRTEGNFSPNHQEFALDLALCVTRTQALDTATSSIFNNHIGDKSAIMGHSMGGGATILAAQNNSNIETIVCLAPAETNPSAVTASSQVTMSALILSGSSDGVTPPVDHHVPIYYGLSSSCKYFISITGGAHCYFANTNFNCDFGESSSSTGITVTRTEQQQVMNDYVSAWLDFKLKDSCSAYSAFVSLLGSDNRITSQDSCTMPALAIAAGGATTFCSGDSVYLSASIPVNWSTGVTASGIYASQAGNYFANDPVSCSVSNSVIVNVNPIYNTSLTASICNGETYVFGTQQLTTEGTYYHTFSSVSGCDSVVTLQLGVNTINNNITQNNSTLTAAEAGATYQWVDCDNGNNFIAGQTAQNFTAQNTGNYAVIISKNGCSDTSACVNIIISGIRENEVTAVKVFPNPSSGDITVHAGSAEKIISLEILNALGEVLVRKGGGYPEVILGTAMLAEGVYFLRVKRERGESFLRINKVNNSIN